MCQQPSGVTGVDVMHHVTRLVRRYCQVRGAYSGGRVLVFQIKIKENRFGIWGVNVSQMLIIILDLKYKNNEI